MRGYKLSYFLGGVLIAAALFTQYNAWKHKQEPAPVIKGGGLPDITLKKPVSLVDDLGPWTFFIGGALLVVLGYAEQRKKEQTK
jgi:hypothetical protein